MSVSEVCVCVCVWVCVVACRLRGERLGGSVRLAAGARGYCGVRAAVAADVVVKVVVKALILCARGDG